MDVTYDLAHGHNPAAASGRRCGHARSRIVTGVTVVGVRGHLVAVEAHVGRGLPSLTLTGLLGLVQMHHRTLLHPGFAIRLRAAPNRSRTQGVVLRGWRAYRQGFSRRHFLAHASTSRRSQRRL
jgi:hypothetical protein